MTNGEGPTRWSDDAEARARHIRILTRLAAGLLALVLVIVALSYAKGVYTDWLWFESLGFLSVFTKILVMRIWLFFGGAIVIGGLLVANLYVAYRFSRGESLLPLAPDMYRLARLGIIGGVILTVFIMSVVFGAVAQGRWETFLLYFNRVPFGVEDPQFHKDMSFHVAVIPLLHFVQGWFMGAVIAIGVAVVALYAAILSFRGVKLTLTPRIRAHLALLLAALMITIAAAHYLDIFELLFSGRGAAPGAGYADLNARLPVLWLLVAIALVSAVGFVVSIYYGGLRLMIAAFSLWAVIAVVAGAIYPVAFQRFRVKPDEFVREELYIQRAIDATTAAYNLNLIDEQRFPYNPELSPEIVAANPETINNIRLWDHRPLRDTYAQIQTFRQYYNFVGVDVDRYHFPDGEYRQVMLSGRELFPEDLGEDVQNWVNRKLIYTHGYGVIMSPVTEATTEGRPEFFLKDLPPKGRLEISRPEIYYGENTRDFVIVNTDTDEFNYPGPEGEQFYANYQGTGGIDLSSFGRRAAYAWQFLDFNLLISGQVNSDSRVQYRRQIQERAHAVAPFLRLDADPYMVIGSDGRLWWIQDAYTTTDRYAYSARFRDDYNYIRNSVKIVLDAYNGSLHFLVIDPEDPLIQMYRRAFPDLLKDFDEIDELDPVLREHIRYPIDLFSAQAEINLRYHMRDPAEFFPSNDLWARAQEVFLTATNTQDIEPYYIIMKLPGEQEEEFVLLLPFTPGGVERKNLVGWMAARSDRENYGKLVTFIFPEGQVDGPEQVEARITSDEDIGRELSLLCPEGKLCIRGNLLAIPMGEETQSILYVEPLYIRAEALALPELKKVIVADAKNVIMTDTLSESLARLLGSSVSEIAGPVPPTGDPSSEAAQILKEVGQEVGSLEEAVEGLKESLESLEDALTDIRETIGGGPQ